MDNAVNPKDDITVTSVPTSNTLDYRVQLCMNGVPIATIDAGDAKVIDGTFNQIVVINGLQRATYRQSAQWGNPHFAPGVAAIIEKQVGATVTYTIVWYRNNQEEVTKRDEFIFKK
jgi:hypothetical protein